MHCLLIVDDYQASRKALVELLTDAGYECVAAADGSEAIELIRTRRVDLILLDINMPKINGMQVLAEIRHHRSAVELPVIMVTAYSASGTVVDALTSGANDCLIKPIDLPALLARVRTQLQIRDLARIKDEFLSIASHDLKNPLTAMLGVAETLAEDFPVGAPMTAEGRWLIDVAVLKTRQMICIVTDFLDMQAAEQGHMKLRKTQLDLRRVKGVRLQNQPTGGESSTGLGLAWCKQLIDLHGGRIGVHNGERGGAVFWFELPRVALSS